MQTYVIDVHTVCSAVQLARTGFRSRAFVQPPSDCACSGSAEACSFFFSFTEKPLSSWLGADTWLASGPYVLHGICTVHHASIKAPGAHAWVARKTVHSQRPPGSGNSGGGSTTAGSAATRGFVGSDGALALGSAAGPRHVRVCVPGRAARHPALPCHANY